MINTLVYPDIIIELGINHNGNFDTAQEMLHSLAHVVKKYPGKIYAKTQKRTPRLCVPREMWDTPRKHPDTGEEMTYIEYKERMELDTDQHGNLAYLAVNDLGFAGYFVSVWDNDAVDDALKFAVRLLKIPSPHITNLPLINKCADTGLPMIISTGMSSLSDVAQALSRIPVSTPLTLMVTTSTYPCPDEEIGLGRLGLLADKYPYAKIGFSSHSVSPYPVIYSTLVGAEVVEFHYTLDRSMQGSDHSSSLELPAVELIARELARIPKLFMHDKLDPTKSESKKMKELRG